ncbi:MAG TPA: hypothetical protein VFF52_26490 [Isosphaeraceae bacterium]|nr:hypothetical protein [Isosphaeraceae bacterium]
MKPGMPLALRPAIGLVIDQDQIAMSVVATTPRGRREIARQTQRCDGQSPEEVLGKLLEPWVSAAVAKRTRAGPWVHVGIPQARVFQATLPITSSNRQNTPQSFFLEAVQATNLRAEDRIIDLIKLELDKQPLACVCACPRATVTELAEMLERLGTRVAVIEPAPLGLFRAAAARRSPPRGSKVILRCFLGAHQAIGVLALGAQPLFWHLFDLTPGEETVAILAAYSTLWMMGRHSRITAAIDTVIVHGRPEVVLSQDPEALRQRTGARWLRCAEPDYDPAAAAMGTALARPLTDDSGLDLARTFKSPPSIRDIFPWGELALQSALLGAVTLFLSGEAAQVDARLKSVGTGLKAFTWLKDQNQSQLEGEKKAVQERWNAIETFRSGRAAWSASLRTIAADAPEKTIITSLSGDAPVEAKSKGGASQTKRKLVVNFTAPMAEDGSPPPEIHGFLATLRGEPALTQSFPLIEVTGLKTNPARDGGRPSASFSIVGLPRIESTPKKAEPPKKAAAKH